MSLPVLILFFASAGWGLTWLPIKYFAERGIDGPMLVFIAFSAALLLILPFFIRQYSQWKKCIGFMLLIAIFGGFANLAFQTAISSGNVVRVMILFYLLPVWSVLGGRIFLKEKIDRIRIMTVALALSGAFLILGGVDIFDQLPGVIDLLAIGSGFALAMNNLVFRATQNIPMPSKVSAMYIGCVLMIGIYLLSTAQQSYDFTANDAGLAALYGILWLLLVTFGTQWGVTKIEAGRASIIIVTELVVAVISSTIILNQQLNLIEITGAIMVISAALLEGVRVEKTI